MPVASLAVPYLDPRARHALIEDEIDEAVAEVIASGIFVCGPRVAGFERAFADYVEASYCVAVGSGGDALRLALTALGIGPGDEVITQANGFFATVEAIAHTGARPVLVDVVPPAWSIDVDAIGAAVTRRTKAVVPVHLFGQPGDLAAIDAVAQRYGLAVVEDASQAHGARYAGRRIGARGVATWSFDPEKNLSALGQGGAVTTHDPQLAAKMRVLRNHGRAQEYVHETFGCGSPMDELQGAALQIKLPYLDAWNLGRRRVAEMYDEHFGALERPSVPRDVEHAYHVYPILTAERDAVRTRVEGLGVGLAIHYPVPIHLQPACARLGYRAGAFPHSERLAREELSLPISPELGDDVAAHVARLVASHVR
ncbi:MAG: DegT/DnrJ/EryC1/StrS family aminotransferase [Candidatus Eremiobacteraeota bacterium]|nr:DegT/DnrJ/EryC1/StrS family aminotransferase [Candidatus Eremiobacteraeota bacterium]